MVGKKLIQRSAMATVLALSALNVVQPLPHGCVCNVVHHLFGKSAFSDPMYQHVRNLIVLETSAANRVLQGGGQLADRVIHVERHGQHQLYLDTGELVRGK